MKLTPTKQDLVYQPLDPLDLRLGQLVQFSALTDLQKMPARQEQTTILSNKFCLLGYPDDRGIAMNGGRPGAKDGPSFIRKSLFKMTADAFHSQLPQLLDVGDLLIEKPLAETHADAQMVAQQILQKSKLIAMGGGHDFGYSDAAAFMEICQAEMPNDLLKPLVLNFDAHLDVRPAERGPHSGTPFRRLLEAYKDKFDFFEIGIQPQCNSRAHLQWAESQGAIVIPMQTCDRKGLQQVLMETLDPNRKRPLWISLDIDSFCKSQAPGCSQSWPTGFTAQNFLPAFAWLLENFHCLGMGIYEVAPELDRDQQTSQLAALILHQLLRTQSQPLC